MARTYEDYFEKIQSEAQEHGLVDFRLAREEFHNITGKFEDSEPWFELRMTMFLDWYILDRRGPDGLTPVEQYLVKHKTELDEEEIEILEHLTVTMRSVFELVELKDDILTLQDLVRGGKWLAKSTMPTVGLNKEDILGARLVFFGGVPTIGRGLVLHPKEANETIKEIVERAVGEGFPFGELVNHLDKMRLKLDRYSNVRIQHVYRHPDDALF